MMASRISRPRSSAHASIFATLVASGALALACGTAAAPELGEAKQALACTTDETCTPSATPICAAGTCVADTCGNGKTYAAAEQCDDGANNDGDGCSATCQVEPGYTCVGQPSVCTIKCGDGVLAANEQCDDGNLADGDGCSASCKVEAGFSCSNPKLSVFYTRTTNTECYAVPNFETVNNTPPAGIPAARAVPGLSVWGSYRSRHVAGAGNFADVPTAWRSPTVMEWDPGNGIKTRMFGGFTNPGQTSRKIAANVAQGVSFDFGLGVASSIRATVPDTACGNNDDAPITYRIDSMSMCTPICVTPTLPASGTCVACNGDLGDANATAACGTVAHPFCPATGSCGKCTSNAECVGHAGGPVCNTTSGACGTACEVDADCADPKKWCNNPTAAPGGGTCAVKTANSDPLPAAAPINGTCTPAVGTRVCASGACDTDNKCGLLDGKACSGASAQDDCRTKCTSGVCGECASSTDCPAANPVCDTKTAKCGPKPVVDAGTDAKVPVVDAASPVIDSGTSSSSSTSGAAATGGELQGGSCSSAPNHTAASGVWLLGLVGLCAMARRRASRAA